jgi:glycosyltransferase involved in cell wall biosynthesis
METSKPKLSFVVPSKDRIEWVAECVSSLLGQSEKDIEVILVDDGSTDGTHEMLTEWLKDEPRFRIFRNEKSIGAGMSRNRGVEEAKSDIIAVCDDDDFYAHNRAEVTIKFFEKAPEGVMFNAPYVRVNYNGEPIEMFRGQPFNEEMFKKEGRVNYFCHPVCAYRKKDFLDIGRYKAETEKFTDDYQFVKDWIESGKKIEFINTDFLCFHRVLPSSIMAKHRGFREEWVRGEKPVC